MIYEIPVGMGLVSYQEREYGSQFLVTEKLNRTEHWQKFHDCAVKASIHQLTAKILERELSSFRYPATWWDGFKEAYFPAWAKQRFPVKWVGITSVALYNGALPDEFIGSRVVTPSMLYQGT